VILNPTGADMWGLALLYAVGLFECMNHTHAIPPVTFSLVLCRAVDPMPLREALAEHTDILVNEMDDVHVTLEAILRFCDQCQVRLMSWPACMCCPGFIVQSFALLLWPFLSNNDCVWS
jgi:hypothetical protein